MRTVTIYDYTCKHCNKPFSSRVRNRKFCSNVCKATALSPLTEEEFWAKIQKGDGCWTWAGLLNDGGYGQIRWRKKLWLVHRLAYTLAVGPIPHGLHLDHTCRNRVCVRPDHLEPVTQQENNRREWEVIRTLHCPMGHEFTPENTYRRKRNGSRICRECTLTRWSH